MSDFQHPNGGPATPQSAEALRADIERTRTELAGTVDALSQRLDVKARAQARAEEIVHDPRSTYVGIGAAVAAVAVIALIVWRKKR